MTLKRTEGVDTNVACVEQISYSLHVTYLKQFHKMGLNSSKNVKTKDLWDIWDLKKLCKNFTKTEITKGEQKRLWNQTVWPFCLSTCVCWFTLSMNKHNLLKCFHVVLWGLIDRNLPNLTSTEK